MPTTDHTSGPGGPIPQPDPQTGASTDSRVRNLGVRALTVAEAELGALAGAPPSRAADVATYTAEILARFREVRACLADTPELDVTTDAEFLKAVRSEMNVALAVYLLTGKFPARQPQYGMEDAAAPMSPPMHPAHQAALAAGLDLESDGPSVL
jgi:hypothetical protein